MASPMARLTGRAVPEERRVRLAVIVEAEAEAGLAAVEFSEAKAEVELAVVVCCPGLLVFCSMGGRAASPAVAAVA